MKVTECMRTDAVHVEPGTRLGAVIELMLSNGLRHIPVVDEDRKFIGIVRIHELRAALAEGGDDAGDGGDRGILSITELGTPTLHGDESTENAWALLSRSPGFSPLPVVADGRLVGTVSHLELLRAMAGLPPKSEAEKRESQRLPMEWGARSSPLAARAAYGGADGQGGAASGRPVPRPQPEAAQDASTRPA